MPEDFVTYGQAVKLKELVFDWLSIHYYDAQTKEFKPKITDQYTVNYHNWNQYGNTISAPTLSQAQKWLREVKDIHIEIKYTSNPQYEPWVGKVVIIENYPKSNTIINTDTCDTYEEALLEGIDKALAILIK